MTRVAHAAGRGARRRSHLATVVCTVVVLAAGVLAASPTTPLRRAPLDESDRTAFRSWFTFLADAQFERRTDDVIDCAALVRHAYREALRVHSTAWFQDARLPRLVSYPDVRHVPAVDNGTWLLFRVARQPDQYAEFADAETLVRLNARLIGRDVRAAEPGDLLFFRHDGADSPSHLMVFVGDSRFDRERRDWLVYHTGPTGSLPGEVRKVSVADLTRHPSPRWRPVRANPEFVGVFRLAILDREH
jgi:uncharacterized protein YfaT (DUF1175 family)